MPESAVNTDAEDQQRPIRALCVYCASSTGNDRRLAASAQQLGESLANEGVELVYGGGAVGLMGVVADAVMANGGTATGVIPGGLFPTEVGHTGLTRLIEVASMHERKAEMIKRADAFVALPGGFGTLEELAEVLTWGQLGLHQKPIGILNINGFFDRLLDFFDRCVDDGILKPANRDLLVVENEPASLLGALTAARDRAAKEGLPKKWLDLGQE